MAKCREGKKDRVYTLLAQESFRAFSPDKKKRVDYGKLGNCTLGETLGGGYLTHHGSIITKDKDKLLIRCLDILELRVTVSYF